MVSHNIINPRCTLTSTTHFHTLMEEGPSVRNTKTVKLFPLRVIGKGNTLILLQSNYDGFLIHRN